MMVVYIFNFIRLLSFFFFVYKFRNYIILFLFFLIVNIKGVFLKSNLVEMDLLGFFLFFIY